MSSQRKKNETQVHNLYSIDSGQRATPMQLQTSGQLAEASGIYQVNHKPHFQEKQFFILKGAELPACPSCGKPMDFQLIERVDHISEDADFHK